MQVSFNPPARVFLRLTASNRWQAFLIGSKRLSTIKA